MPSARISPRTTISWSSTPAMGGGTCATGAAGGCPPAPFQTATLISVLQRQKGVFPASRIHREVVDALTADGRVTSAVPTYAPLQSAFHDGVDFLFERKPGS